MDRGTFAPTPTQGWLKLHTIHGRAFQTVADLDARIRELDALDRTFTDDEKDQWNAVNEASDELRARATRVRELADDPAHHEDGFGGRTNDRRAAGQGFDGALRTLERHVDDGRLPALQFAGSGSAIRIPRRVLTELAWEERSTPDAA